MIKPYWYHISLSVNQTSTSLINTILCIDRCNTRSPALSKELASNNRTLRTKHMSSSFTPITFAIGYWLQLASVSSSLLSPFWNFLYLLFHFGRVWRLHRNSLRNLFQNLFVICWMCPHLLVNLSAFTNWPGSGNTILDFFVRILLRHSWLFTLDTSQSVNSQQPGV